MSKLNYKTRGGSSPQGKPRVYFCCHPADFEKYFELISEEVLAEQNCTIYYETEPSDPYDEEELFSYLGQMQLFIMPVTTKLLTRKNRAVDLEFPFAKEHHIPILPLMQENGLDDLFNEKCGDIQYLNKYNRDDTAISYEEKLKKYLSSVLIGDELAEKVRAAFDAYIFLSYRKKDRKYAQELMRLIHKNDFCRDIAIWYDEFLTPGENFNEAIREALERSELFALAVTPNLVNEINYVMTTEYPKAREAKKKILPAEVVPTDKEALRSKYENIPDTVDAHNADELSKGLLEAVRNIAVRENDSSPEHNFFIGLAYLGGIDVEVDHERAKDLITSAAKAGLGEAAKKLVSMYRTGEGVERSYETAIFWQQELVEQLEKAYASSGSAEDGYALLTEIWACGDYYKELGRLREAMSAYEKMNSVADELYEKTGTRRAHRYLSASYNNIGIICSDQGKLEDALEYYRKSLAIRKQLAEETETAEDRCDLSASYNNIGTICRAQGKLEDAMEYYRKSLAITKQLAEETGTIKRYDDLAVSYYNIGVTETGAARWKPLNDAFKIWTVLSRQCPDNPEFARRRDMVASKLNKI